MHENAKFCSLDIFEHVKPESDLNEAASEVHSRMDIKIFELTGSLHQHIKTSYSMLVNTSLEQMITIIIICHFILGFYCRDLEIDPMSKTNRQSNHQREERSRRMHSI